MARAASALRRWHAANREMGLEGSRQVWFAVHLAIIFYVGIGWLLPWRGALFAYLLLLPLIVMQWLLNGGASIINNFENLAHTGRWSDKSNRFEGAFFTTILRAFGVSASQAQVTTLLCSLMFIFWVAAVCRMMLIVVPAPL